LPPIADNHPLKRATGSIRARLFAALLVASLPGIIFGAMEANRNYTIASRQEAVVRTDDATRASVRLDDLVRAAAEQANALAHAPDVRSANAHCAAVLSAASDALPRYGAFARTDADGRVICGSVSAVTPADVGDQDWFKTVQMGAPYSVSAMIAAPFGSEPAMIVAVPVRAREGPAGAVFVTLRQSTLSEAIRGELAEETSAIVAYDRKSGPIATVARGVDATKAANAAALALLSSRGSSVSDGLIAERISDGGFFKIVAVTPQGKQADIGLRSALILLAPILGAALSFAVVWLAMDWWVLRWFYRLQDMARDFGAGRYAPSKMEEAPSEIADLAGAFDSAVGQARAREHDLGAALAVNRSLTRELHHRVKNNLQVLSSLISRQQRHAPDPDVRAALSEARARMAPVALVYRFINPPEDRTGIDLAPYLSELARQLHVALGGDAKRVTLTVEVAPAICGADDTTNIGLIIAETMITGYANAAGARGAEAHIALKDGAGGARMVCVAIVNAAATGQEADLDHDLVTEVARQLGADVRIEGHAAVVLTLKPPPQMDEV
jgi:two-component sensor histidine kinase